MLYRDIINDISRLPDFLIFYENELTKAKQECRIVGNLETNLCELPGITEHRFNQLQEIEALLHYLNIEHNKIKHRFFCEYLEHYNKALSSRDAEKYAEAEDEVIEYGILVNEVALLRNQYLGIMKALENKNFNLGHITKLRAVGLEDVNL